MYGRRLRIARMNGKIEDFVMAAAWVANNNHLIMSGHGFVWLVSRRSKKLINIAWIGCF